MDSLFKDEKLTHDGVELEKKIMDAVSPILDEYFSAGYDGIDIEHIASSTVSLLALSKRVRRKYVK